MNLQRHWVSAILLMFTACLYLARPVLWMFGLYVLESGTGDHDWMLLPAIGEAVLSIVAFIAGILFLTKRRVAFPMALTASSVLCATQLTILLTHPRRLVEGPWWTVENFKIWIVPIVFAAAALTSTVLARRSERLLTPG